MSTFFKPRRVEGSQSPGREVPQVNLPCCTIEDQLGHRLAGRRRIQHAPHTVAGGDIGAVDAGYAADQRQAIVRDRPEAGLACRRSVWCLPGPVLSPWLASGTLPGSLPPLQEGASVPFPI